MKYETDVETTCCCGNCANCAAVVKGGETRLECQHEEHSGLVWSFGLCSDWRAEDESAV